MSGYYNDGIQNRREQIVDWQLQHPPVEPPYRGTEHKGTTYYDPKNSYPSPYDTKYHGTTYYASKPFPGSLEDGSDTVRRIGNQVKRTLGRDEDEHRDDHRYHDEKRRRIEPSSHHSKSEIGKQFKRTLGPAEAEHRDDNRYHEKRRREEPSSHHSSKSEDDLDKLKKDVEEQYRKQGVKDPVKMLGSRLMGSVNEGHEPECLRIWEKLKLLEGGVNEFTLKLMMQFYSKKSLEKTFSYFKEFSKRGIEPSKYAYHHLIVACFTEGALESAEKLFWHMIEKDFKIDSDTMTPLLRGCIELTKIPADSRIATAVRILEEVRTLKISVKPILLSELRKLFQSSDNPRAVKLIDKLSSQADHHVLSDLQQGSKKEISKKLTVCIQRRDFDKAHKLIQEAKKDGVNIDPKGRITSALKSYETTPGLGKSHRHDLRTLLKVFLNAENIRAFLEFTEKFKDFRPKPDSYRNFLNLCQEFEDVKSAIKIFKVMETRGFKPDASHIRPLRKTFALAEPKDRKSILSFLEENQDYHPDAAQYEKYINLCIAPKDVATAIKFYEKMKQDPLISLDRTCQGALVEVFLSTDAEEDLLFIMDFLEKNINVALSKNDYDQLIKKCCTSTHKIMAEIALRLIEDMKKRGDYTSRGFKEAILYFEELRNQGIHFNVDQCNRYISLLGEKPNEQSIQKILDYMRQYNIEPHGESFLASLMND